MILKIIGVHPRSSVAKPTALWVKWFYGKADRFFMTEKQVQVKREDIDSKDSSYSGVAGWVEIFMRRFRVVFHCMALFVVYILGAICMGIALVPGVYLFIYILEYTKDWSLFLRYAAIGSSISAGYLLYGFSLILIVPLVNFLFPLRLKPWRGIYYSLGTIPWYIHNALTYLVRFTFLHFITPTPFNIFFYKMMGMKIGRGCMINSTNISDPCLIELEDKVTIGGSATVICHYAAGGFLVIAPVKIGKGATIGMKATVMGDVEIGEKAKILANSLVMPKTRIGPGEMWAGVPAQKIQGTENVS